MSGLTTLTVFVLVVIFLIASMFLQGSPQGVQGVPPNQQNPELLNPEINKIADGLYLTNFKHAKDYKTLKALGIRQILTVGAELPRHGEPMFKAMHVRINDSPDENIKKYFNSTYNFINRGPTLVHCAAGISRSATIVAAFLMRKYKLPMDKALAHIWECRKIINPNHGFKQQLRVFEKELQSSEDGMESNDVEDDSEALRAVSPQEQLKKENCANGVCAVKA